jgi:hypothetical protein
MRFSDAGFVCRCLYSPEATKVSGQCNKPENPFQSNVHASLAVVDKGSGRFKYS